MKYSFLAATLLLAAPLAHAGQINITYSPDFAEKLETDLGVREGEYLKADLQQSLTRELSRRGVDVARIDVVIEDADPNRPTFEQLKNRPGLSMAFSKSIGGMDIAGTAYDASGNLIDTYAYDWENIDIRFVQGSTWQAAKRTSDLFASKFAKRLAGG